MVFELCQKEDINAVTELDFHIPQVLKSHVHFNHLKEKKIREFSKILKGYKLSKTPVGQEKISYLENLLLEIKNL